MYQLKIFATTVVHPAPANNDKFPSDLTALVPKYIQNARIFQNPRFPNQAVGYIYVAGSTTNDATNILAYENVPESQAYLGRSVLYAGGNVTFMIDDIKQQLQETEERITAAGGKFKLMPIDYTQFGKQTQPSLPNADEPQPNRKKEV